MSSLQRPGVFKISQADEELISRRVTSDNPEAEPNILDFTPPELKDWVITHRYDLPRGMEVRCRHCRAVGKMPNHRRGYVVRADHGRGPGILVGNKCGADHYKDEWGIITDVWDRKERRRRAASRLQELGLHWEVIRTELFQFSDSPMWGIHDTISQNIREKLPRLQEFISRTLSERGGDLFVMERFRDLKAEEKQSDDKKGQIFRMRERGMGSIGGREFIVGTGLLKASFEDYRAKLIGEIESLRKLGSDLGTEELEKRLRRVTALFKQIRTAIERVRSLQRFVDPEHLRRLCLCATDWSKHRDGRNQYTFDGKNIIWIERDGQGSVKCPIQAFVMPPTKRLQMYIGP